MRLSPYVLAPPAPEVLIGQYGSTFSMLIGELIAYRYAERHESAPTAVMCDQPNMTGYCLPELPLVGRAPWWHVSLAAFPRASLEVATCEAS